MPLALFLLHRVVDRLSDDLAVLDEVGVGAAPHHDTGVLVGPLRGRHPSFDSPVVCRRRRGVRAAPRRVPSPSICANCPTLSWPRNTSPPRFMRITMSSKTLRQRSSSTMR